MATEKPSTPNGTVDNSVKADTSSPKKPGSAQHHVGPSCDAATLKAPIESQEDASVAPIASPEARENDEAHEMSLSSHKRSLPGSSEDSLSKKTKMEEVESPEPSPRFPSPSNVPAISVDKETWQGYCEIESDPAYFSVILRDIGIQGVDVQELLTVDQEQLSYLAPVYGLVLLFRHREFDQHNQEGACPDNVWFANQMPGQNSCATLAMIHTLLNVDDPDIEIGEHMHQFKDFTKDMTPLQRGHTFASWKFVKGIHNSFAKKMDMLENDKYIAAKAAKAQKSKAASQKKIAETKKAPSVQTKSRSRTARRNSEDSNASSDSVEAFEENAHHYIAFVPINGEVWKLDGMDKQPTLMGEYDEDKGEMWIPAVSERINALIQAGDNDYGIFAIMQSPLVSLRNQLCEADNTIERVDGRLDTLSTDWKEFLDEETREPPSPSFMGSFSEEQRAANPIPASIKVAIDKEDVPELLVRHRKLVAEMRRLMLEYMQQVQVVSEQDERAEARRWDYGPAIQVWIGMLAENGFLQENIDDFKE
ncbi:ubiquitin carboxyl-terminal hydrolase, family 1 [Paraphaeosphaeria sporulosa]